MFSSNVEGVKDHMLLKKEEESFQVVAVTSTSCTTIIGDLFAGHIKMCTLSSFRDVLFTKCINAL